MYVILDTNVIHQDFHLSMSATHELLDNASNRGLTVCVPEVVVREMVKHFREQPESILQRLQDVHRGMDRLQLQLGSTLPVIDVDGVVKEFEERFRERLNEHKVKVLPLPGVNVEQLLHLRISRRRPFKNDGRGMFDALIWESVVELWRQYPDEQYAVITEDKDYEDTEGERIHPDLLADLGAEGIAAPNRTTSEADSDLPRNIGPYFELHKSIQSFNEDWSRRSRNQTG